MKHVLKLTTDGKIKTVSIPDDHDFRWYAKEIGCEWIEVVNPRGYEYSLVIDEEGILNELPVNPYASIMYGFNRHGVPIVGDALLMKSEYGPDGVDLTGLDDDDLLKAKNVLLKIHDQAMEICG